MKDGIRPAPDRRCVLWDWLEVTPGSLRDLRRLEPYHYCEPHRGPFKAIYVLRPRTHNGISQRRDCPDHPEGLDQEPSAVSAVNFGYPAEMTPFDAAGVVLYTMPTPNCQLRDAATGGIFKGFDRATQLAMLNARLRCISRVIIDPRFRGLGLAGRLVRETMPLLDVPIIEARAVMGRFHPFFERAGMQAWDGPAPPRCTRLAAAFESAGITQRDLIDAQRTQGLLDALDEPWRSFVEREMALFLKCYGKRRNMPPSLERTRFVLSRLSGRAVYYIWFNPRYSDLRRTTQDPRRMTDDSQPTPREVGCRPFAQASLMEPIPVISRETAARFIAAHVEARCHRDAEYTQGVQLVAYADLLVQAKERKAMPGASVCLLPRAARGATIEPGIENEQRH